MGPRAYRLRRSSDRLFRAHRWYRRPREHAPRSTNRLRALSIPDWRWNLRSGGWNADVCCDMSRRQVSLLHLVCRVPRIGAESFRVSFATFRRGIATRGPSKSLPCIDFARDCRSSADAPSPFCIFPFFGRYHGPLVVLCASTLAPSLAWGSPKPHPSPPLRSPPDLLPLHVRLSNITTHQHVHAYRPRSTRLNPAASSNRQTPYYLTYHLAGTDFSYANYIRGVSQPFDVTHSNILPTAQMIRRRVEREMNGLQVPYDVRCKSNETPCHIHGTQWEVSESTDETPQQRFHLLGSDRAEEGVRE